MLDDRPAHDPTPGIPEPGVVDVVARHVLQVAGQRIQTKAPTRVDVAAADPSPGLEDAPDRRHGHQHTSSIRAAHFSGGRAHVGDAIGALIRLTGPRREHLEPRHRNEECHQSFEIALTLPPSCGFVTVMFTTACAYACAYAFAAPSGARVRATAATAVLETITTWYVPSMDDNSGFEHKQLTRRPPSLT